MKKNILFIMIATALALSSCNFGGGGGSGTKTNTNADVVLINKGKMSFYDAAEKKVTPFEKEQDSVVNILFTDRDHLYYTAVKEGELFLKMIDFSTKELESKLCADWNLTVEQSIDYTTGKVSRICLDTYSNNIIIFGDDPEEGYMRPYVYDVVSNNVRKVGEEEYFCLYELNYDASHFLTESNRLYFVSSQGKACLNDKINYAQYFDEDELNDIDCSLASLSPDGKKVLYSVAVYWGEGWGYYCVANIDGSSQELLTDSDLFRGQPAWLADGSLVYVGSSPLPEGDPDYDADYNTTQSCVKLVDAQQNTAMVAIGEMFTVRPFASEKRDKVSQEPLEGCDIAVFENGKVTFYNSTKGVFVPFVSEQDSVINGLFVYDNFFYTVKIGDELYLKAIYMSEYTTEQELLADWGLKLDDCVSETYGKTSELLWVPKMSYVGINYNFNWDFYNFSDVRFYNYESRTMQDGWIEEDDESDIYDDDFMQYELDLAKLAVEDNNLYYNNGEEWVCISDKINFKEYVSDPEEYTDPEFKFYYTDPTQNYVAYSALIEWGDLGHGPLCLASIDGKVQMAFKGTDDADLTWGWLSDGSLLYVSGDPSCIMIVKPGKTAEVFANSTNFVVKGK